MNAPEYEDLYPKCDDPVQCFAVCMLLIVLPHDLTYPAAPLDIEAAVRDLRDLLQESYLLTQLEATCERVA